MYFGVTDGVNADYFLDADSSRVLADNQWATITNNTILCCGDYVLRPGADFQALGEELLTTITLDLFSSELSWSAAGYDLTHSLNPLIDLSKELTFFVATQSDHEIHQLNSFSIQSSNNRVNVSKPVSLSLLALSVTGLASRRKRQARA
ncbi:hypothetical protein HR060_02680 [Catenovulum sp. SM1970]|uniref:hypothetical protein n=1 Tax=Marinifaba aquimaris TaxID=2741323 RepID=UPI00157388A0|nr:hypothetical protein [Marinifaba aquimaris]NTS75761.1 hypothetical protein [Marinifaba aquimaris]